MWVRRGGMNGDNDRLVHEFIRHSVQIIARLQNVDESQSRKLKDELASRFEEMISGFLFAEDNTSVKHVFIVSYEKELDELFVSIDKSPAGGTGTVLLQFKNKRCIESRISLESQISSIVLSDRILIEAVVFLINNGLSHITELIERQVSYSNTPQNSKKGESRLQELAFLLRSPYWRLSVPDLVSSSHSKIKNMVSRGANEDNYQSFIDPGQMHDSSFLNVLQSTANDWLKTVQKICRTGMDIKDGTFLEEVQHWSTLQETLIAIAQQLQSSEIKITMSILVATKRWHNVSGFASDSGLTEKILSVKEYNQFLSSIPLEAFRSNDSTEEVRNSMNSVAAALKRFRFTAYPADRFVILLEHLSQEAYNGILDASPNLFTASFTLFSDQEAEILKAIEQWDEILQENKMHLREVVRKRGHSGTLSTTLKLSNNKLRDALGELSAFRRRHNSFTEALCSIGYANYLEDLNFLYEPINVLQNRDIDSWTEAQSTYNQRHAVIEKKLIKYWNEALGNKRSSAEISDLYALFAPLMKYTPRLMSAMNNCQKDLLSSVKHELTLYQAKVNEMDKVEEFLLVKGLSPVSSTVITRSQLRDRTTALHRRCEILLGKNWEKLAEGKTLAPIFEDIKRKTDCETIFTRWKSDIADLNLDQLQAPVLKIVCSHDHTYELSTNIESLQSDIFSEVKSFVFIGFVVPSKIIRLADKFENIRLDTVRALEQVQAFLSLIKELHTRPFTSCLLEKDITKLWSHILDAAITPYLGLHGDTKVYDRQVIGSDIVESLEEDVSTLVANFRQFETNELQLLHFLHELSIPDREIKTFPYIISSVQSLITEMASLQPHGIDKLIFSLNSSIEAILVTKSQQRLEKLIHNFREIKVVFKSNQLTFFPSLTEFKAGGVFAVEQLLKETARVPQVYQPGDLKGGKIFFKISHLIEDAIYRTLKDVEGTYSVARDQLERWKVVGPLCSLQESDVSDYIGSDINICLSLLTDIIEFRTRLEELRDSNDADLTLRFDLADSQLPLLKKFDYWRRVLCDSLLEIYVKETRELDEGLRADSNCLGKQDFSYLSLENVFLVLEDMQRVKKSQNIRNQLLLSFSTCEAIFSKFHMKLPSNHISVNQLESEQKTLDDSFEKLSLFVDTNKNIVATMLDKEDIALDKELSSVLSDWHSRRAKLRKFSCSEVLATLATYKVSFASITEKTERLYMCSKVLTHPMIKKRDLESTLDDLLRLETAWRRLSKLECSANCLLERTWRSITISDISEELDRQKKETIEIEQMYLQAGLFETAELIKTLERSIPLLRELKDSSLSDKHWNIIFDQTSFSKPPKSLIEAQSFSLRDVINLNFIENAKIIRDTICDAQREAQLEKSLIRIKDFWEKAQYTTFQHKSGAVLVNDWNQLQKLSYDDLEELVAMKNSTFHDHFEQICLELESKLAAFVAIIPDWTDLQFHWLDLYGIVGEKSELSYLLTSESLKFQSLTNDFQILLSKVFRLPSVLDVLHIQGSDVAFKQMLNKIKTIKSSLSRFLEQQRALFPRFYFLGNRDLLRLLGAGRNLSQISCYFEKMFGSIADLQIDDNSITGICSVEGETLKLSHPIAIGVTEGPVEWLNALDSEIKNTLLKNVEICVSGINDGRDYLEFIDSQVFQVLLLTWQIYWTAEVDKGIRMDNLTNLEKAIGNKIAYLSDFLIRKEDWHERRKVRSLIIELTHSVQVVTKLLEATTKASANCVWYRTQKFYFTGEKSCSIREVHAEQCNRSLQYSFNYIGVPEKLIYTSTLEEAFAALSESLTQGFGGCLFGPAGTGKTETIKALSQNLGKMVLVFNCDGYFDLPAMSRLILGVAQIGAWGCFDELNRLSESVLSSVTGYVEEIQTALSQKLHKLQIMKKSVYLNHDTGLFVTLNPGYSGRSYPPENLKKRFREYSMTQAETLVISEVMLKTFGFREAAALSQSLVDFFTLLRETCSSQKHYEFGLRSVKKVLQNCADLAKLDKAGMVEKSLLQSSLNQIILPALNASDEDIYLRHFNNMFPGHEELSNCSFSTHLFNACENESAAPSKSFLRKCQQLYYMQKSQQAIIITGDAGVGKTAVWKTTLRAMESLDGVDNVVYVIDAKTMGKDSLYGRMNKATLEWKDGIFTSILRAVNEDPTGSFATARVWIVLDSDLDPEYIETLNSALDDNKILTLPTGERISIPGKLRLILEVDNLEYSTPATITRCAILWLSAHTYSLRDQLECVLAKEIKGIKECSGVSTGLIERFESTVSALFSSEQLSSLINYAESFEHIMGFERSRVVPLLVTILSNEIKTAHETLRRATQEDQIRFMMFRSYQILLNVIGGDISASDQKVLAKFLNTLFDEPYVTLIEDASLQTVHCVDGRLRFVLLTELFEKRTVKEQTDTYIQRNTVIPTVDTLRHENHIIDLIKIGQPIILCGPPGCGKTMLINHIFSEANSYQLVSLNFSKDTSVSHIFKAISRHTKFVDGPKGPTLCPKDSNKNVILFCDEINLPKPDRYGTQSVILFLRLLIEKKGFWRDEDNRWISVDRIHVVGACNPSSDPGRNFLSPRFLRHMSILFIDHPNLAALSKIYKSLIKASFSPNFHIDMRGLCEASICVYDGCKTIFTSRCQAHYVFSPRDLTRWLRGMYSATTSGPHTTLLSLLRIWAYEAWRIFADRLVNEGEKSQFRDLLENTISDHFPEEKALLGDTSRLIFSSWLSADYKEASKRDVLEFLKLKTMLFCEEEGLDPIILHDEMVDHIIRIDHVLRQAQGHCMLIGAGRTGKTTMVKFVCWLSGLHFMRPSMHRKYELNEFDSFLRDILLKCTVEGQKICLVIDELNIMETAFLERMNTLLANCDIPDLFQEEHYEILMSALNQKFVSIGYSTCSEEELYDWFTTQISQNLHVLFTICDPFVNKGSQIISSPALFNRCVLNWVGVWSQSTLEQVSNEIVKSALSECNSTVSTTSNINIATNTSSAVLESLSHVFLSFHADFKLKQQACESPSFLLDSLLLFRKLSQQKYRELENDRSFLANGLKKLDEAVFSFEDMTKTLQENESELQSRELDARQMLDQILMEQSEAEHRQDAVRDIRVALIEKEDEARQRRNIVRSDLEDFEPVMQAAQLGVKNIKKQHLTEIRSMSNPPQAVKNTLEAVCSVLGHHGSEWRSIQQFVRSDEFILNILYFDTEEMLTEESKAFIEEKFTYMPDFTFEKVHRASKACGPLFQWVTAQIRFKDVLKKIEPLRAEAKLLEDAALLAKARLLAAEDMMTELEENIKLLKNNYMNVIKDMERIRSGMDAIKSKLHRSESLIESLSTEKGRWERSISNFRQKATEVNGNCVISSLIFTYFGKLDEKQRSNSFGRITELLQDGHIKYDFNYDFVGENMTLENRLAWLDYGLSNERFLLDNLIMILDSNAVPYIIDPSSEVSKILSKKYGSSLQTISFLEEGFIKKFVNSVKFGDMLLVKDAEVYDPVIGNVVTCVAQNSRFARNTKIADLEVSVSPNFRLFLHSSDGKKRLSSFLESRVRVINFSTSRASIETHVTEMAMTYDAPDIEAERCKLSELANCERRSRSLENQILDKLNASKGSIIESDELITTLETVKQEARELELKVATNRNLVEKLKSFEASYAAFASHCASIYYVLEKFSQMHWLYEVPTWQFFSCLEKVYSTLQKVSQESTADRFDALVLTAYQTFFSTFAAYLSESDRIKLAFVLCVMYRNGLDMEELRKLLQALLHLLGEGDAVEHDNTYSEELEELKEYIKVENYTAAIKWAQQDLGDVITLDKLVSSNYRKSVLIATDRESDCSFEVIRLAKTKSKNLSIIALGSLESTDYAEQEILRCSSEGGWILLQNLQMSMSWVQSFLVKKIEEQLECMDVWEKDFKIFMTCNFSGEPLPSSLVQQSYKATIEGSPSFLHKVRELWRNLAAHTETETTIQRSIVIAKFILAWFHAILDTRSQLAPIGFKKRYDFNECDLQSGQKHITDLLKATANQPPVSICEQINFILGKIIYGGKVDEDEDLKTVQNICCQMFQPAAFAYSSDPDVFLEILPGVLLPRGSVDEQILWEFLNQLPEPDNFHTLWLGLPEDAVQRFEYNTIQEALQGAVNVLE